MSRRVKRTYDGGSGPRTVQVGEHAGGLRASIDGEDTPLRARRIRTLAGGAELAIATGDGTRRAVVVREGDVVHVHYAGRVYRLRVATSAAGGPAAAEDDEQPFAASPMTGVMAKLHVSAGDTVDEGGALFVVEAMKMEFVVDAPRAVVVKRVLAEPGDRVDIGQTIVEFEEEPV